MKCEIEKKYLLAAILLLGIVLGVIFPILSYVTFLGFTLYILAEGDETWLFMLILLVFPLAYIFKASPESTSLFTYILLVFQLKLLFTHKINRRFFYVWIVFLCFCLTGILNSPTDVLKQAMIPMFLYFFLNEDVIERKNLFLKIYIFSILLASIIGYFAEYIPNLLNYISFKTTNDGVGGIYYRFSGVWGDPNYYTVNLILALLFALYLNIKHEISTRSFIFLSILIISFGALTQSKTFLLMLVISLSYCFYLSVKTKRYNLTLLMICCVIVGGALIATGTLIIFDGIIERIMLSQNVGQLTTNRSIIWENYIRYFNSNPSVWLIGNGLCSAFVNRAAPHNTYIDFIFYYGLIGSAIFIYLIKLSFSRFKKCERVIGYMPMIALLIMLFSLSSLTYMDFQFQLAVVLLVACDGSDRALLKT